MEWYYGSGIDDLVVPKGELPDRLPSPDSWFKWEMNAPQSYGSGNKYFTMGSDLPHEELNLNGKRSSCYDDEMGASVNSKDHSRGSSIGGELSNSVQQSAASHGQPDYHLDGFQGIEQMDDIFLSSLLDDLPVIESFHKSVCISPSSQSDTKADKSVLTCMADSQTNLSGLNSIESSKCAGTDDIDMPVGWEHGKITRCKPEQNDQPRPPVKVEHMTLSEENSTNGNAGVETSLEESILEDLEIVMTQLTDKTRIFFRDALYRLAKNSNQHLHLAGERQMKDETIRRETPKAVEESESETGSNIVDRAIANLIFGEMEANAWNIPPTNLKQEIIQASGQHSFCSSRQDYSTPCDSKVPIHGH